MLHQRGLTAARILARPQISLRQNIARRYASHGAMEKQLSGPADNAFNRERLAVKAHAEATAGTPYPPSIAGYIGLHTRALHI